MSRALGSLLLLGATSLVAVACASGSGSRDQALLASVLRGMKTDLVSVRLGAPTKEWLGGTTPRNWKFLYVTPATAKGTDAIAELWYANLIAGAYEAQCGKRTADCLVGFEVAGIQGSRMQATRTPPSLVGSRALGHEIRTRFARAGLSVSSISFERPWGLAPVVTVASRHPQRSVTAFYKTSLFLHLPIEGFLLRMVDAHGRVFLVDGGSFRTKEGSGWTRPGLRVPGGKQLVPAP